jgi:hypothetical protein
MKEMEEAEVERYLAVEAERREAEEWGYESDGARRELTKPGRASALDRFEHLWNRYSSAALAMLKGAEKAAALERVKQHQAQMKAVTG